MSIKSLGEMGKVKVVLNVFLRFEAYFADFGWDV
jgi:hypothetical protein